MQTNIDTVYQPDYFYDVTAGVGQFNGSLVAPYIQQQQQIEPDYKLKILTYSTQASVYNFVANPVHAVSQQPINCTEASCASYLFTGGLDLATPWPPTVYPSASVIKLAKIPSRQVDFRRGLAEGDVFEESDCSTYSDNSTIIAGRLCVAPSRTNNSFIAGRSDSDPLSSRANCSKVSLRALAVSTMADAYQVLMTGDQNYPTLRLPSQSSAVKPQSSPRAQI